MPRKKAEAVAAAPIEEKQTTRKIMKTVFGGTLNIRKEPTTAADIVGTFADGTNVTILEDQGEWLKVEAGYIMAKWVR